MKLTEKQLQDIEEWAALAFTPEQVEIVMGFATGQMENDTESILAYNRGLLTSEAEVWKSIFEHAKAGSSPAQTLAITRLEQAKSNFFIHG